MENTQKKTPKRRTKNIKKESIFKKYSFEITILSMIAFGLFLLFENFELKILIKNFFIFLYNWIKKGLNNFLNTIFYGISKFESSDIFGISLLFLAFILIFLRWRNNLIVKYSSISECPKCNNRIHRIRRKKIIKILSYFGRLKTKHYHCHLCKLKVYKIKNI